MHERADRLFILFSSRRKGCQPGHGKATMRQSDMLVSGMARLKEESSTVHAITPEKGHFVEHQHFMCWKTCLTPPANNANVLQTLLNQGMVLQKLVRDLVHFARRLP